MASATATAPLERTSDESDEFVLASEPVEVGIIESECPSKPAAESENKYADFVFNIALIGDDGVGKTFLTSQATFAQTRAKTESEVIADLNSTMFLEEVDPGPDYWGMLFLPTVMLRFWEISGWMPEFSLPAAGSWQSIDAVLFVFDASKPESFKSAKRQLKNLRKSKLPLKKGITTALIANKDASMTVDDLDLQLRILKTKIEAREKAKKHGAEIFELPLNAAAYRILQMFHALAAQIIRSRAQQQVEEAHEAETKITRRNSFWKKKKKSSDGEQSDVIRKLTFEFGKRGKKSDASAYMMLVEKSAVEGTDESSQAIHQDDIQDQEAIKASPDTSGGGQGSAVLASHANPQAEKNKYGNRCVIV